GGDAQGVRRIETENRHGRKRDGRLATGSPRLGDGEEASLQMSEDRRAEQPNPGELLMTFEHGQDVYRVELRDFQEYGVEGQIFQNGILLEGTRFSGRPLAERWAERKREAILKGGVW